MEKITANNFRLVGLKLKGKTTNENNQAEIDCGNLWQRFKNEEISQLIPQKLEDAIFAVYYDYEKDETQPYSYFIGCKVDKTAEVPEGLSELLIPSQIYLKSTAKGVLTGCIASAWKEIWSSKLDRKFGFDFEVYDHRSQDWSNAEVDIFLSKNE